MRQSEQMQCAKCGTPVRHVAGGLMLCAICGVVAPAPRKRRRRKSSAYEGLGLEELRERRRELEREVEKCYRAVHRAARLPKRIARVGVVIVLVGTVTILTGVLMAFMSYGSVNYRYVTAYGTALLFFGLLTVTLLVWGARDPRAPVLEAARSRLSAAERELAEVDDRIAREQG